MKRFSNRHKLISSPIQNSKFNIHNWIFAFLPKLRYSIFSIRYSTFLFLSLLRSLTPSPLRFLAPSSLRPLAFSLLLALATFSLPAQQQWTEPLNITNLGGYSKDPDMVIDHNNIIHVVWTYKITSTHWLIYYTYSEDDGLTWAEPLDLLQNTDLWMSQPHIACDSKNNLYVTYTYNTMDYNNMLIKMITYDGHQWSEPIIISEGMPGSHYNKVVVDSEDNLYVFWGYYSLAMYFRYRNNGNWSDIYCPYCDSTDSFYFSDGHDVSNKMMHWVGSSLSINYYGERPQYYEYSILTNNWENPEQISNDTINVEIDLDLNKFCNPESAYRTYPSPNDETIHIKKEGDLWGIPDLVSGTEKRQEGQQIAIDQNNDVHVVETEFYVSSVLETQLVHYFNNGNSWMSQPIDSSNHMCHFPKLLFSNNRLYVVYHHSEESGSGDLRFSKYDIITGIKEEPNPSTKLKIYPNPSHGNIYIEFENNKQQHIDLSVFDMTGKHIITLISETKPPGKYRLLWKVTDKNRKEDAPHLYLVRLQLGWNTVTRTVEIIR